MTLSSVEERFAAFCRTGDAHALADVFDRTAPELGRIASYLAGGDAGRAEELLQATWLAAMTHASRWDMARPLLPWLLGVLGNHARSERRARRRGASSAAADALGDLLASDDPVRASEDAEFQRLLAQALAAMPPPFREAVALHVQHGLTAKEIGEALGRPAGTVRTQIVRGLDRLRELLPRGLALVGLGVLALSPDALANVRERVLAKLPLPAPLVATAASRWALAALAAAALVAAPMLLHGQDPAPAEPPANVVAAVVATAAPDGVGNARDLVATEAQSPVPEAAPRARRRITVHVRHDGEPAVVANERVGLIEDGEVRFVATDAAGNAVFDDVADIAPNLAFQLFVSGTRANTSLLPERLPPPDSFDRETTLRLERDLSLTIAVVDAAGRPVAGAEIEGNGSQWARRRWCPLGVTDERGELRLRDQAERVQLRARANGHAPSPFADAVADGSGGMLCSLRLAATSPALRGRVVDEQGRPVAAELGTIACGAGRDGVDEPWYDRTAADGTFVFDWLPAGHVAIVARVRGGDRVRRGLLRVDVPAAGEVEVRLVRGAALSGSTRFAAGEGAAGMMLHGRMLADAIFELPFCTFDDRTGAGGAFAYDGLLPGRWLLDAGIGEARVAATVELRDGEVTKWIAVAPALHEVRVRLRDERGEPIEGWRVQLCDAQRQSRGSAWPTEANGITMPHAQWRWPADEPLVLAVFDPEGYESCPNFPTFVVPGLVPDGNVIDVTVPDRCRTSHRVRGFVVDSDGQPLAATVSVASPRAAWDAKSVDAGADGAFAIGPFPPGRVMVSIAAKDLPWRDLGGADVPFDGDLDLGTITIGRGAVLRAVAAAPGADDLRLQLVPDRGNPFVLVRDDGGAFVHDAIPYGRYTLRGSGSTHVVRAQPVVVDRAEQRVTFACERAPSLRIAIVLDADEERASPSWTGTLTVNDERGAELARRIVRRRFAGRFSPEIECAVALPPGRYELKLVTWTKRTARASCEVTDAGGTVTLRP